MTDKEILYKAIKRARENGYKCLDLDDVEYVIYQEHIFSHDFAKAFWGNAQVCYECGDPIQKCRVDMDTSCGADEFDPTQVAYMYHLQVLIVQENPLKYLEKFLKGSVD